MNAGTKTMRINVASRTTATASPNPNSWATSTREKAKVPNKMTMTAAALVMTDAVAPIPSMVDRSLFLVRSNASFIRDSRKTS